MATIKDIKRQLMGDFHYKHIIWHWNGTLFNDAWLCIEVMNGMLVRRNLPRITPEEYERLFDFPVIDYYRRLGFDFYEEPFEKLSDEFIKGYGQRLLECQLRDGAHAVLVLGLRSNIKQYILSAMQQDTLNTLMAHFKLKRFFADVVGLIDHHAHGKIELGEEWLDMRKLNRKDILFIGDTTHDFAVAQALGVDCYLIHSGHHSREKLAAAGVRLLKTLLDLYEPPKEP